MSDEQPQEGWQAEKHYNQRVYHYIQGTMSLCRKLGFYTGELAPDNPDTRTKEDCSACVKKLNARALEGNQ